MAAQGFGSYGQGRRRGHGGKSYCRISVWRWVDESQKHFTAECAENAEKIFKGISRRPWRLGGESGFARIYLESDEIRHPRHRGAHRYRATPPHKPPHPHLPPP